MTRSQTWIQRHYSVPAQRGMRITFNDGLRPAREAVITGFRGQYLRVRFDGEKHPVPAHPTWAITYPEVPQPKNRGWCWGCGENRGLTPAGLAVPHLNPFRGLRLEPRDCEGVGKPPTHRVRWIRRDTTADARARAALPAPTHRPALTPAA